MAQRQIIKGPEAVLMIYSFFLGSNLDQTRVSVDFYVEDRVLPVEVVLNSLTREDGSGEQLGFVGFYDHLRSGRRTVKGTYNVRTHTGVIEGVE